MGTLYGGWIVVKNGIGQYLKRMGFILIIEGLLSCNMKCFSISPMYGISDRLMYLTVESFGTSASVLHIRPPRVFPFIDPGFAWWKPFSGDQNEEGERRAANQFHRQ